jgi:apolipoprotein N-acyltransferase
MKSRNISREQNMSTSKPAGFKNESPSPQLLAPLHTSWLWLFPAAAAALLFANGRNNIAIVAWLAPVFVLRYLCRGSAWRLAAAYLVMTAAWAFQFRGMVPAPQPLLAIAWFSYGVCMMLPFIADRLLARRIPGFVSTLIFPCAAMGFDYLLSLLPYESWGSPAYTQYGNLPLMQLASVTGIYGITFLMAGVAAVVNWAWENGFDRPRIRRGVMTYAAVLVAVLCFGSARLMSWPAGPTVRITSLTTSDVARFPSEDIARRAYAGRLTDAEYQQVRDLSRRIDEHLLLRAGLAADAGARVVFWGETNSFVLPEDEPWLMQESARLAREKKIYFGIGNEVWHYGRPKSLENSFVLFDPDGRPMWKFLKAHPVPGGEERISMRDDGRLKFTDTPFGRISGVICFDADSVQLLHQAGRGAADLVLVPSNDWQAIDPWHTQMAVFRAVEQGFNMVRHVSHGLSVAVDYQGRVYGAMDHYQTFGDRALIAELPTRGVRTIYSRVGDLFSWLSLAGLAVLAAFAVRRRPSLTPGM